MPSSLYPPTNMHQLPYSGRGRLSALTLPPATHALLAEATDFEAPPSQRAIPKCALDYLGPRVVMTTHVSYICYICAEISVVQSLPTSLGHLVLKIRLSREADDQYLKNIMLILSLGTGFSWRADRRIALERPERRLGGSRRVIQAR